MLSITVRPQHRKGRVRAGDEPAALQVQQDIGIHRDDQRRAAQINIAGQLDLREAGAGLGSVLNQPPQSLAVPRGGLRESSRAVIVDHRETIVLRIFVALNGLPLGLCPAVIDVLHGI